ncbi:hypothetical protein [Candidatus Poriferisodalis sp.]|uniref:hypothetical protein n=1 Tax=Candidatus Poriferisodalis sp. TaxID=3101277 RepID=UPI003B023865
MSTLWTPEGEHRVPRERTDRPSERQPDDEGVFDTADDESAFAETLDVDPETGLPIDPRTGGPFDPQELAEMQERLREAQEQLISVPAAEIVQNHMMGLFELAALHLRREPADLDEARLPIDALGLLVDHLADQLPAGETLRGALHQIRLAYVEIHKRQSAAD